MVDRVDLADLLPALTRTLQEARQVEPGESRSEQISEFLNGLLTVGRTLTAQPELRTEADVQLFLLETGRQLIFLHSSVAHFVSMTIDETHGGWEDGEAWEPLLKRRSALQFLDELYAETSYGGFFNLLRLEDLDDLIRERGDIEGFPDSYPIPADIPVTHWWWWWPRTPPAP